MVASEVKNLATQTAKATGNISQQIAQIQAATEVAVKSLEGTGRTIGDVSQIAATVAAGVGSKVPRRRKLPVTCSGYNAGAKAA